jgi:hypothetical protein
MSLGRPTDLASSLPSLENPTAVKELCLRWFPLGESLLIRQFRPLWNVVVEGFGNNPTGGPREGQKRSPWDTLHPGRTGVGQATEETIKREQHLREKIDKHLKQE